MFSGLRHALSGAEFAPGKLARIWPFRFGLDGVEARLVHQGDELFHCPGWIGLAQQSMDR